MAVTNYVSPNGSNTSPYDTPAKAARNPNSAIALWTSGGGNRTHIAPGEYNYQVTSPPYAGIAGSYNEIVGDVTGEVFGVEPGEAVFYKADSTIFDFSSSSMAGTRLKNITVNLGATDPASGRYGFLSYFGGTLGVGVDFIDCNFYGSSPYDNLSSLVKFNVFTQSEGQTINFIRCRFVGSGYDMVAPQHQLSATPSSTPSERFHKCDFISTDARYGLVHIINLSNYRHYVDFYGCTVWAPYRASGGNGYAVVFSFYADSAESKCDFTRNALYGYRSGLDYQVSRGARADNFIFGRGAISGATRRVVMDHLAHFPVIEGAALFGALDDDALTGELARDFNGFAAEGGKNTTPGATRMPGVRRARYRNGVGSGFPCPIAEASQSRQRWIMG